MRRIAGLSGQRLLHGEVVAGTPSRRVDLGALCRELMG
jgi:hypothetical protein